MTIQDQTAVLKFLSNPMSYGKLAMPVTTTTTHISVIFFVGQKVFKLKRAVHLPYVDFSTVAQRLAACHRELHLNRRTAPMLYVGVRCITREADGHLVFDGEGELVDSVVEMVRFDENTLFDRMAVRDQFTPALLTNLARTIARFHIGARIDRRQVGVSGIASVLETNERALADVKIFSSDTVSVLTAGLRSAFQRYEPLLSARDHAGKVRRCHGDLHLRNVCLVDGIPTLFDCLEFDEAMATIDVLYDVAFLVMDMWRYGLLSSANLVFNRYLDECDETDGLPLMPFFMALRASIRAHVTALQAEQASSAYREDLIFKARQYGALAVRLLAPTSGRLIAIGGFSGTGKSTVSAAIASQIGLAPGARILASDRIRKRFHRVRVDEHLPAQAYRPEASERVYALMAQKAKTVLDAGYSVITDAVFGQTAYREQIERVARDAKVPFTGIWLHARPQVLFARVDARRGDVSDATANVVRAQLAGRDEPTNWIPIDTEGSIATIVEKATKAMEGNEAFAHQHDC